VQSDYLFDNFLRLPAFSFNGQRNLSLRVGPNRERPLPVAVMEELMQASLFERHVAYGLTPIASPYIREEAGSHRYNVGTDTPKLCATSCGGVPLANSLLAE
jgi:hypothetical protein